MTIEDFNKKTKLLLAMILQDLLKYRELSSISNFKVIRKKAITTCCLLPLLHIQTFVLEAQLYSRSQCF